MLDQTIDLLKRIQGNFSLHSKTNPEVGLKNLESVEHLVPYSKLAKDIVKNPDELNKMLISDIGGSFGPRSVASYHMLQKVKIVHSRSLGLDTQNSEFANLVRSANMVSSAAEAIKSREDEEINECSNLYIVGKNLSEKLDRNFEITTKILFEDESASISAKTIAFVTATITSTLALIGFSFFAIKKHFTIPEKASSAVEGMWDKTKIILKDPRTKTILFILAITWALAILVLYTLSKMSKDKGVV